MTTFASSTLRSFLWSASDVVVRQGTQLVVSVVLARLLTPVEFGTVALLYFFNGIALVFIEGGLSSALIQRVSTTRVEESSVFWLNMAIGTVCAGALAACAPALAVWFGQPVLVPLTLIAAATIVVSATSTIQTTLLSRSLDFKPQMKAGLFANTTAGATAIGLAYAGFGVWALSLQTFIAASVNSLVLWTLSSWRPEARFDRRGVASLWRFGGFMLGAGILENAYTRIYSVLIGRWSGTSALGFYSRADSVMQFPMASLTAMFSRVAFPLLSATQHDPERMRSGLRAALQTVAAINAPLMLGLSAAAAPAIALLLGAQWEATVPVLRVLCVAGAFWPLQVMNYQAVIALGHARLMFQVESAKRIGGLIALILVARHGLLAIAAVGIVYNLMGFAINAHCAGRFTGYGFRRQLRDLSPIYIIAAAMAVLVSYVDQHLRVTPVAALALLVVLGVVTYVSVGAALRLESFSIALTALRGRRQSHSSEAP